MRNSLEECLVYIKVKLHSVTLCSLYAVSQLMLPPDDGSAWVDFIYEILPTQGLASVALSSIPHLISKALGFFLNSCHDVNIAGREGVYFKYQKRVSS